MVREGVSWWEIKVALQTNADPSRAGEFVFGDWEAGSYPGLLFSSASSQSSGRHAR